MIRWHHCQYRRATIVRILGGAFADNTALAGLLYVDTGLFMICLPVSQHKATFKEH